MRYDTKLSPTAIEAELGNRTSNNELFVLRHKGKTYLTDEKTVQLERENVAMMKEMRASSRVEVRTIAERLTTRSPEGNVLERLRRTTLTDGQKEAVTTILTSPDKAVGMQGLAGTGKTYMLATATKHLEKAGYTVEGFAPSHEAVGKLEEAVKNSRTMASAMVRHENLPKEGDKTKTVLLVDEASMISSADMNKLLRMVIAKDYARVVFVGDVKQLDAVGAGPSFRQLQENGMQTAQMLDIQRQNTEAGRFAVLQAASGEVKEAFEGISKVHETGGKHAEIASAVAETYLNRSPDERDKTAVIVLTNDMRRSVNQTVQDGLKAQGVLKGDGHLVPTMISREFTAAEAGEVQSYLKDDIVMALKPIAKAGMEAGTLYSVTKIDEGKQTLSLASPEGVESTLLLDHRTTSRNKLAVFQEHKERFYVGDEVKFRITDRENDIVNANVGTVGTVTETHVSIMNAKGRQQTFEKDSLAVKGMQLSYSSTAHGYQGSTEDRVVLAMEATEQLATQKAFYVGLSRMREDTELVTNDAAKLTDTIENNTGERVTALEVLAEQDKQDRAAGQASNSASQDAHDKQAIDPKSEQEKSPQGDLFEAQSRGPAETEKARQEDTENEDDKTRHDAPEPGQPDFNKMTPDEVIARVKDNSEKTAVKIDEIDKQQERQIEEIQQLYRGERTR